MKQAGYTQKYLRKRKMLMVMPLIVIPFLTLAFWAMGGGKAPVPVLSVGTKAGLNLNLPDANLKEDKVSDKLSFYEKADRDSLKLVEWMRSDPYYKKNESKESLGSEQLEMLTQSMASRHNQRLNISPYEPTGENPEQKIMEKLSLLEKELNKPPIQNDVIQKEDLEASDKRAMSLDVDRLENLMQVMAQADTGDLELKHLEKTLDKILDVQHPERVKEQIQEKLLNQNEVVFSVSNEPSDQGISLLDTSAEKFKPEADFYGVEERSEINEEQNAIEAVVHESQTLVNGSIIKLRLVSDNYVGGSLIPKGSFVFGTAVLNDERLKISILFIRNENSIFPVKLEVFDLDGLPGIYIPGGITRDVAKQSAENSLQLMELGSMDPSFKAQATVAGLSAAKSLLSKKVKQVKVLVKANYKVLLMGKELQK